MFAARFLALACLPIVFGQSTTNTLGIQAIEAHFVNSGIVPTLLSGFNPTSFLTVTYDGVGTISPGQLFDKDQVAEVPSLQVTPADPSVQLNGTFTVVMADAGPVGTKEDQGQTRHWLVNDVTLAGTAAPWNVSVDDGMAVTEYAGPAPPWGSGAHRYVILLYSQPPSFGAPNGLDYEDAGVSVFNLTDYVISSNLGPLVAGTYLTVEQGTANYTPSPTSAVVTSTLAAVQSTSSTSSTSSSATPTPSVHGQTSDADTLAGTIYKAVMAALIAHLIF